MTRPGHRRTSAPAVPCGNAALWRWMPLLALLCGATLRAPCATATAAPPAAPPPAPRLFPDYAGVVIPPNIAPLNFRVEEPGVRYRVELRSVRGNPVVVSSRLPTIQFPPRSWQALLRTNAGERLRCDVSVQHTDRTWRRFATVTNTIAPEPIDGALVYRLLKPIYNIYVNLGIYQRHLESFEEQPLLQNRHFHQGCLNCHTFLNHAPNRFALNIRTADKLNPMLLVGSNDVARVDKTLGYLSWHPSGRLLAFSGNRLSLFFHTIGETRDVFDARSDLGIYRVDSNRVLYPAPIALAKRNETWPAWSPDGRHLYYSSAPVLRIERFRQVLYDLMRVRYDLDHDRWGEPEVVVPARETGLSANQPKVSPDGRFVLFCLCDYGNFPIYRASSDLYLLDLETRRRQRLEINSDNVDSWHAWSSNGRWVVFSSKRLDGLFARPFFSYVDPQGHFHKPFLLPQPTPAFYDSCLNTFNVPELVRAPVAVKQADLVRAILNPAKILTPTADPQHAPREAGPGSAADEPEGTYHELPKEASTR
ncbi:MAG: PD40 domain-containing protein [Verrucomicrobia bacterium]|nr:PD40 domain-containing protein [Verrucomicrobiota bacterium]